MLAREGRVTNHELVKHFKAWLTHPTERESARQRFKEYVNTLATIKVENGKASDTGLGLQHVSLFSLLVR